MTAKPGEAHIGLIVEGAGDKNGMPLLLRRHLQESSYYKDILGKPIPCKGKGSATTPGGIEGFVSVAASRPGCRGVMVVLDADDDPVCELGPALLARAQLVSAVPVVVTLADTAFEDWIFASAETLELNISYDATAHAGKSIKEALAPTKYVKPVWQPKLTERIDISLARGRNTSLHRTLQRFDELVEGV